MVLWLVAINRVIVIAQIGWLLAVFGDELQAA